MPSIEDQQEIFDDEFSIKPKTKNNNSKTTKKAGASADSSEIRSIQELIDGPVKENRSHVLSIRITPSAFEKIDQIWMEKRKKDKMIKHSTVASDILIDHLDKYK